MSPIAFALLYGRFAIHGHSGIVNRQVNGTSSLGEFTALRDSMDCREKTVLRLEPQDPKLPCHCGSISCFELGQSLCHRLEFFNLGPVPPSGLCISRQRSIYYPQMALSVYQGQTPRPWQETAISSSYTQSSQRARAKHLGKDAAEGNRVHDKALAIACRGLDLDQCEAAAVFALAAFGQVDQGAGNQSFYHVHSCVLSSMSCKSKPRWARRASSRPGSNRQVGHTSRPARQCLKH